MAVPRNVHYSDLGGIETVLRDITELIEYPLAYPEVRLDAILPHKAILCCIASASCPCACWHRNHGALHPGLHGTLA